MEFAPAGGAIVKRRTCIPIIFLLLLPMTTAWAQHSCWEGDNVYAEVVGTTVTIFHDDALYNCCPDAFAYTVVQDDSLIFVTETEDLTSGGCDCWCCIDLSVEIGDFAPWIYYVRFSWFDYETEQWQEELLDVYVPDQGQSGTMTVTGQYASECQDELSVVPDEPRQEPHAKPGTWGSVKGLYR
jgi:hypothetical protein